jgi:hypothetical protein
MKKLVLAMAAVVAVALVPSMATAATITFSRSTSVSGTLAPGTSFASIANLGLRISCTTGSITALASDRFSGVGPSTGTSLVIRAVNSHLSQTGLGATTCAYTIPIIGSGNVTFDNSCDVIVTARTTTTGDITVTANGCSTQRFTTGGLTGCTVNVDRQSITVGLRIISGSSPTTNLTFSATRAAVDYTTNGRCAGDRGGNARTGTPITNISTGVVATVGLSNN